MCGGSKNGRHVAYLVKAEQYSLSEELESVV